jgi:hypothetical protein
MRRKIMFGSIPSDCQVSPAASTRGTLGLSVYSTPRHRLLNIKRQLAQASKASWKQAVTEAGVLS